MNKNIKKIILATLLGVSTMTSIALARDTSSSVGLGDGHGFHATGKLDCTWNWVDPDIATARIDRTSNPHSDKGVWVRLYKEDMYNLGYDKGRTWAQVDSVNKSVGTYDAYFYLVQWSNTDMEYDKKVVHHS